MSTTTDFNRFESWIESCDKYHQLLNIRENIHRWGFDPYEIRSLEKQITEKELQIKKAPTPIEA